MKYLKVFRQEILHFKYIMLILVIGFLYIALSVYLPNYRFILSSVFGSSTVQYKIAVLFYSLGGLFTAFSTLDAVLLIITSLLLGINLALIARTKKRLDNSSVKFLVGGGGLFGLVSVGCSSCGYSLLSILGLGTSLSFLPFGTKVFYWLSIGALLFSIGYMTKRLNDSLNCNLDKR